jgi:DNA-binding MarR family transcriptional regulator
VSVTPVQEAVLGTLINHGPISTRAAHELHGDTVRGTLRRLESYGLAERRHSGDVTYWDVTPSGRGELGDWT